MLFQHIHTFSILRSVKDNMSDCERKCSAAIRRETEGFKEEEDPEEQREVLRDAQRLGLIAGTTVDGFTKWHTEVKCGKCLHVPV